MARLDVHPMPGARRGGYVVDVQARLLDHLATRAVVPLLPLSDAPPPIKDLNPVFDIDGTPHVLLTQAIASVPVRELRGALASLDPEHDRITRALDVLFLGL
jgi:toxin CcdB